MMVDSPEDLGRWLVKRDHRFRDIVQSSEPFPMASRPKKEPYQSLIEAIAHQQLHGKAAATILARFRLLFPMGRFPRPEMILNTEMEQLRSVGFSQAKAMAILDVAARALNGSIPDRRHLSRMSNELIIQQLAEARGVGRWTVEMLLIFDYGRLNVLPVDDFGVKTGYQLLANLPNLPKPKELRLAGERWQPNCSIAAWYLWKLADRKKLKGEK